MPLHRSSVSSPRQSLEYLDASQSPVPSLTSATLRSSSVSSSVNSLSPDAHQATTPRDLLPQFQSVSSKYHHHHHHAPMDTVANDIDDAEGTDYKKRRREDDADDEAQRAGDSAPLVPPTQLPQQPESKKRRKETTRRLSNGERRPLTGSTDFVKRFGLGELYDQFVRPYVVEGQVRRTMPDLAASDYLRGVKGAVAHDAVGSVDHDLVALVKAPPKSEFSRLELLPMASIRAAFAIGNDEQTKKPVHHGASELSKSQHSRHANGNSGSNHRHRSQHAVPASQPKAAR
ncbi:hypothetical protein IWW47_001505 [Coemansia sp. RSA 2052]|nr:hypothetical protein IWW47_001505 [Coemansia sp. RSA 2052]